MMDLVCVGEAAVIGFVGTTLHGRVTVWVLVQPDNFLEISPINCVPISSEFNDFKEISDVMQEMQMQAVVSRGTLIVDHRVEAQRIWCSFAGLSCQRSLYRESLGVFRFLCFECF